MSIKVNVQLNTKQIIQSMNIPKVKRALANEMIKDFTKYVPFQTSALSKNVSISVSEPVQIIYNSPYARYVHEGKLYLAKNGSSWAKKGEVKIATNIKLMYGNGRGARWTETAKAVHGGDWTELVEEMIKRSN